MSAVISVLKIILAVLLGLLLTYLLAFILSALLVDPKRLYPAGNRWYRFLLDSAVWAVIAFGRIRITVKGAEKLPDGPYYLVQNHSSNFDPLATWFALKDKKLVFISKATNLRLFCAGRIVRRCGCLPIERDNPRESVKTLQRAAEMMQSGNANVGVFPEGTRNHGGDMLPFHNGVLKAAKTAGAPVVVSAMRGTYQVQKNWPWKRSYLALELVDVIPPEEVMARRTGELGERIRREIEQALSENA